MADTGKTYHGSATNLAGVKPAGAKKKAIVAFNAATPADAGAGYEEGSHGQANARANFVVPDVNPADAAVARLQRHSEHLKAYEALPPPSRNDDLRDRVARLENILQLTLDSLNAASMECVDGAPVLTLPDLPT